MELLRNKFIKKQLFKSLKIAASISSFLGVFVALIPCDKDEYGWLKKIIIIGSFFVAVFIVLTICFLAINKRKIGSCNNVSVNVMYGDILNIKSPKEKPVVVIPVNSSYDYIVEDSLDVENPIVSKKSLHGKWVLKLTNNEKDKLNQLKRDIEKGIKASGLAPEIIIPEKRGNKERYKLGSAIFIEREDCTYLLFAFTDFDKENHVIEKHIKVYVGLINDLIIQTGRCQGRDVYVPVMGVGLSLFGLDHKGAFGIMKTAIINQKNTLKSSINIVIYTGDKDKISIFDD